MKKGFLARALGLALLVGSAAHPALAQRDGDQGVGLMIGNPSGFTWKMFLDERLAIDAAIGVNQGEFNVHATLLYHDFSFFKKSPSFNNMTSNGDMGLYFGIGPRELFDDDAEFGIRTPVGINYLPNTAPWEMFFEVAPVLRLTPSTGFDFDYAIGARYYFPTIRPRSN